MQNNNANLFPVGRLRTVEAALRVNPKTIPRGLSVRTPMGYSPLVVKTLKRLQRKQSNSDSAHRFRVTQQAQRAALAVEVTTLTAAAVQTHAMLYRIYMECSQAAGSDVADRVLAIIQGNNTEIQTLDARTMCGSEEEWLQSTLITK